MSGRHGVAGANDVRAASYVIRLEPDEQLCQDAEVPTDAASVEVFAGVFGRPGPPLSATLAIAGAPEARTHRAGGYGDGWLRLPLPGRPPGGGSPAAGMLCLRNEGSTALALGGGKPGSPGEAVVRPASGESRPADGRAAMRWRRGGRESWWSLVDDVAARSVVGKADIGRWTPAVMLLIVWLGALWLTVRQFGSPADGDA